ncbi:MAG: iron-containing alcohol dehydrogenase [Candidatus Nanoarchaeia archaeon]|nr:iron-containing alcohol dehydrogenase [Candidatus Haiyanarchaeum thermophilum]MCW1302949.1 iron-containing alcohol dehydrogenase [Candidatus Haiyanarchaeum thermophilum]MCW1303627.1 iron-containing alcohol dehydrogenase [Candidatus Haiyanarchaeum thermophilum]MCW1306308.1 iron-containing alcohol dehydrogenase [Candidatus Haiyanarchaeum thermophilum]MCW1307182.1 iron-containing alcohol dehydrogenase [Candidatus Haiyanarchaeum thermophilum]
MRFKCSCGKIHASDLEFIQIDERVEDLGKHLYELNIGKRCLLVFGPNVYLKFGRRLEEELRPYFKLKKFLADSFNLSNFKKLNKIGRKFDFLIGVGGGSTIDLVKFSSYSLNKCFIAFPTAPSHDGIASPIVSIKLASSKLSLLSRQPKAIFIDLSILMEAPSRLRLAGFGDIIAKYTALADWKLGRDEINEYYCEEIAKMVRRSLKEVVKARKEIASGKLSGLRALSEALVNCGIAMAYARSSRPCSGSEHLFSHYLDIHSSSNALHGEKCALGTIIMSRLHGLKWKKIKQIIHSVGLETKAEMLNINIDELVAAVVNAKNLRIDRYTILHKLNLSEDEAYKIIYEVGV